jgi:hypothetical protein
MIETVLVKKLKFPPGLILRLIARSTYVGMPLPAFLQSSLLK